MIFRNTALLLALPAMLAVHAQGPDWVWAQGFGSNDQDETRGLCTDAAGNLFVTGYFAGNGITIGGTQLTNALSNGTADGFLAKVAADGTFLWALSINGIGSEVGEQVACTPQGDVILAGRYDNSITLGSTTLTSVGGTDVFIAKFSATGSPVWAVSLGGDGQDLVNGLAVGADGRVAMAGSFSSSSFVAGTFNLANGDPGDDDVVVALLDASGTVLWADAAGDTYDDVASTVAIDAAGNVVVGGFFACAEITFGGTTLVNANDNYNDLLLVKYDPNGNVLWAQRDGGIVHERYWAIACHPNGDISTTGGYIDATLNLSGTLLTNTTTDQSWYDLFVARYTANGALIWATTAGGIYDEFVTSLAVDAADNTVVAGEYDSPLLNFGAASLPAADSYDAFVVSYAPGGNALWARSAGGGSSDRVLDLACGTADAVYVGGYSTSDPLNVGPHTLDNNGDKDLWLAQLATATGVGEGPAPVALQAFPSVGTGIITVVAGAPLQELLVVDAAGRTVLRTAPRTLRTQVELPAAGSYTIMARTAAGNARARVVVVR